ATLAWRDVPRNVLANFRQDAHHIGLRCLQLDAGFQPRDHGEIVAVIVRIRNQPERRPNLHILHSDPRQNELEALREDARHGITLAIERDGATDDAGIGSETPLPQTITQNHGLRTVRAVFIRSESASENRLYTERAEKIAR